MKKALLLLFIIVSLLQPAFAQKSLDFGIIGNVGIMKLIELKETSKPPLLTPIDMGANVILGNSFESSFSVCIIPKRTYDYMGHVWRPGGNGYYDDTIPGSRTFSAFAVDLKMLYLKNTDNEFLNLEFGWSFGYMQFNNKFDFPTFDGKTMDFLNAPFDTINWSYKKRFGHVAIIAGANYELEHIRLSLDLNVKFGFFNAVGDQMPIMPSLMFGVFVPLVRKD